MVDEHQIVADVVESRQLLTDDLPDDLRKVAEQHVQDLVQLAGSLKSIGQDPETIRAMVATLLTGYQTDLLHAIGARK